MSGALGSVLFAHFDVAIVPSCAYRSAFPCGGVLPSRATQGLLDNTCWSGVRLRHRRRRRRWRWRPGHRWGRSWRVFPSSVMALACLRRRWGSAPIRRVPSDRGSPRTWRDRWVLALLGGFHLIGKIPSDRQQAIWWNRCFSLPSAWSSCRLAPVTCRLARSARVRT